MFNLHKTSNTGSTVGGHEYTMIDPVNSYSGLDAVWDENGVVSDTETISTLENAFIDNNETTSVNIEIIFDELSDLETIIQMGFEEGFRMCVKNPDQYFIDLGEGK